MASHCPNCGSAFLPDALFCRKCGTKRPQAKSCSEVVKLLKLQLLSWCFDCYRLSLVVMKTEKKVHLKRGTGKC